MRSSEISVGTEYAHRARQSTYEVVPASRVIVREKLSHGRVKIKVLESAQDRYSEPLRRGGVVDVPGRQLVCPWTSWPELLADEKASIAKQKAEQASYRKELEERRRVDPARPLPESYDGRGHYDHVLNDAQQLRDWPLPDGIGLWRGEDRARAAAVEVLGGLPVDLVRDLLAVAPTLSDSAGETVPTNSVGEVFGPLKHTLYLALSSVYGRGYLANLPDDVWAATNDFLPACAASFAAEGSYIYIPEVPSVELSTFFPGPGWLRVAYGHTTSGRRVHAPDCHVLKSNAAPVKEAPTWPAWHLNLPGIDPCGACGGPQVVATPALVAFVAAALVWRHRPNQPVERWQQRACLGMLAEAAVARAREGEGDRSWHHEAVAMLLRDPPGQEGWDAYQVLGWSSWKVEAWEGTRRLAALRLAYQRLEYLERALPPHRRPERPPTLPDNPALTVSPDSATRAALQEWYGRLKAACDGELPAVDLLLFSLPGHVRY